MYRQLQSDADIGSQTSFNRSVEYEAYEPTDDYAPYEQYGESVDERKKPGCCSRRMACIITFLVLTALVIVFLVFNFVIAPDMIQKSINKSDLGFVTLAMKEPAGLGVRMEAKSSLTNADSPVSATMNPAVMTMTFEGQQIGTFTAPAISIPANQDAEFDMDVFFDISDEDVFLEFATNLTYGEEVEVGLMGTISVGAKLGPITLTFGGLTFDKMVTVEGLRGFSNVSILEFDMFVDEDGNNRAETLVMIDNPSNVAILPIGELKFGLEYKEVFLGECTTAETVNLHPGANFVTMGGQMKPADISAANELFESYLIGEAVPVVARASNETASSIPLYNSFLKGFVLETELGGLAEPYANNLVLNAHMEKNVVQILLEILLTGGGADIPVRLTMQNPLSAPLILEEVAIDIVFDGGILGTAYTDVTSEGIPLRDALIVPPQSVNGSYYLAPAVDVRMQLPGILDPDLLPFIARATKFTNELSDGNIAEIGIEGSMSARIGDLVVEPRYAQSFPACVYQNPDDETPCDDILIQR